MIYEVTLVNPKTNEEKKIVVELSPDQRSAPKAIPIEQVYAQARQNMPAGFMPIAGRVRPVTLQ
jgi:hypothetical protein